MMNYDVICVGSALLDIYLKSGAFVKERDSRGEAVMCIEYGGKTEANQVEVSSGGGVSNTAVSFARKGLKTALIAEMGYDLAAATVREECLREGVDLALTIVEEGEETGVSAILVADDGARSVAVYRGASKLLTKEDMDWEKIRSDWLYISSLGGEMALLEGLIGHTKAYGIKTVVNPGRGELERLGEWGGAGLFEGVEVLLLNREEAGMLYGMALTDEVWQSEWNPGGPHYLVITDGRNGGRVSYEGGTLWYEPKWVEAVEETGAGDGFGSGLVAALMLGKSLDEAVEWGKRQAASVVSFMGAKKGLLTREQIQV